MFSFSLLAGCLGLLLLLLVYTLYLLRAKKLTPHVAVRWIFFELLAAVAIVFWGRLPFIKLTSSLNDRQMLLILACIFFVLLVMLILECLVHISKQTNQIRRLTQEVALLGMQLSHKSEEERGENTVSPPMPKVSGQAHSVPWRTFLLLLWITLSLALYAWNLYPKRYPPALASFLTAKFLE